MLRAMCAAPGRWFSVADPETLPAWAVTVTSRAAVVEVMVAL